MSMIMAYMKRHWRGLASLIAMAAGCHLVWSGFMVGPRLDDMRRWLKKNGDADLLKLYDQARDAKERNSWIVAFKAYEKRYGKGAWVRHFKDENPAGTPTYGDIAELAVGISDVEGRDEFLDAHAATYEACVRNGETETAFRYAATLKELRELGGKGWRVAARNPFAIAVYDAVREHADLWNWYLDNAEWCDSFLMTVEPEFAEEDVSEHAGLAEVVKVVRDHAPLLEQFAKEIGGLSPEEQKELADGDNLNECTEALFASCLAFVGQYHHVLTPMLRASSGISMLEAMAVVANNGTAFGLGEDGALDSPGKCRDAAMGFMRIHDERRLIWDFAMDEKGVDCIAFCENVCNYAWCEQVIGMFGESEVVPFLEKFYGDPPRFQLLRVATEMLYRYQELGWAVLNEYCDDPLFKRLLLKPRIGARLAPYYLKKGYDGFAQLDKDERWIDELLDKDGNVKRLDVSWYEMLPIGGDVATVVKKWVTDRPVTAGELGWAAFDIADTASMAFTFGMSKVATTTGKLAVKVTARQIAKRTARAMAKRTVGTMSRKMAASMARKTARMTARRVASGSGTRMAQAGTRKISFLKKVNNWFRKVPGITVKGRDSSMRVTRKTASDSLEENWRTVRGMDRKTWQKMYRGTKTLMWCRYLGHTVPEKLPDFARTTLESAGEFVGKTINSLVAGAGDGLKAAVRETLGLSADCGDLVERTLRWGIGGVLFMLGMCLFLKNGRSRAAGIKSN